MNQVHGNCELGEIAELAEDTHEDGDDDLFSAKMAVLVALFVEAMVALTVPYWSHLFPINIDAWLSILNTFSAGVVLATGMFWEAIEKPFEKGKKVVVHFTMVTCPS